jgi:hypothetical protein
MRCTRSTLEKELLHNDDDDGDKNKTSEDGKN